MMVMTFFKAISLHLPGETKKVRIGKIQIGFFQNMSKALLLNKCYQFDDRELKELINY
jgi:hypothetical protein